MSQLSTQSQNEQGDDGDTSEILCKTHTLWKNPAEIRQDLGPDPSQDRHASDDDCPAGLTNLGATCYVNSILQCLYMNKPFREGILLVEPEVLEQQPELNQLSQLFAQLHHSKMASIDSSPFVRTLKLDTGVQQDSHEFLTLLLCLLERHLSHSKVLKAKTIVQDLFRGSVSHVTRCSNCGEDSEVSSKKEDFYDLKLNVKGLKSLDESLADYLSVEELQGDNQYFCKFCKTRVDATRSIKLHTLPTFLNFNLKRYEFLPKTTTRKKITSLFSFPGVLDMRQQLSQPSQVESIYDLWAVLIHKGTAVNIGHYVANIKDEKTGEWWEFDDEHVTYVGTHPFGEGTGRPPSCSEQINSISNDGNMEVDHQQPSESVTGYDPHQFTSSDAYMLLYSLRASSKDDKKVRDECNTKNMKKKDDGISGSTRLVEKQRENQLKTRDISADLETSLEEMIPKDRPGEQKNRRSCFYLKKQRPSARRRSSRSTSSLALATMTIGDILSILGVGISTGLAWVTKPTDGWFNPIQGLSGCVCTGTGDTLLCPCTPIVFLFYETWMAAMFFFSFYLIGRILLRYRQWATVVFYTVFVFPAYWWSVW